MALSFGSSFSGRTRPSSPSLSAVAAVVAAAVFGAALIQTACTKGLPSEAEAGDDGPVATQLTLSVGDAAVVGLGVKVQIVATPRDANGKVVPGYVVDWSSSDASIVHAEDGGYITAVAVGSATVTAAAEKGSGKGKGNDGSGKENAPGQLKKSVDVSVDPARVATVEVLPDPGHVQLSQHLQMAAVLKDEDGNELTGRIIEWSSGDLTVVQVNETGDVMGVSVGTTGVSATSEGQSDGATIIVAPAVHVVDVVVWPVDVTLPKGRQAQFYAAVLQSDNTVFCLPENPSTDPTVLFNATVVAGCDSAAARLDLSAAAPVHVAQPTVVAGVSLGG